MTAKTCTISPCGRPVLARGWCSTHYARWHKKGDPTAVGRLYRAPLRDRLASLLAAADERGCMNFQGWTDRRGYGRMKVDGRMRKPHRVAYELAHGPIPTGLVICHSCDNPSCCTVSHLFLGTVADNVADMVAKGRADYSGLVAARAENGARLKARAERVRAETATIAGHPADWKRCARCDTFKAPDMFGRNVARSDGLQTYCRPCLNHVKKQKRKDRG